MAGKGPPNVSKSFSIFKDRLMWEFQTPLQQGYYESPIFTFLNADWSLILRVYNSEYLKNEYSELFLDRRVRRIKVDEKIIVKTCRINNGNYNDSARVSDFCNVPSSEPIEFGTLTKDDIKDILPKIENVGVFTIVRAFYGSKSGRLPVTVKEKTEIPSPVNGEKIECHSRYSTILSLPTNLESLSQDFSKLLDKGLMTDVQLICGDRTFLAHRIILAARSDVFSAMLQDEMAETKSGIIDIKDIDASVMDLFLKYLYSGKINDVLREDIIYKLYAVADKYAVYDLMKSCSSLMATNLSERNYLHVLTLADVHGDKELMKAVGDFVTKFGELLRKDAWLAFSEEHPKLANQIYKIYIESLSK